MEDLHRKGVNSNTYRFCWVGNPGDQPLWTPKWHSTLSEKSFRVRKVGNNFGTITNVETGYYLLSEIGKQVVFVYYLLSEIGSK